MLIYAFIICLIFLIVVYLLLPTTIMFNYFYNTTPTKNKKQKVDEFIFNYLQNKNVDSLLKIVPYSMKQANVNDVVNNLKFQYNLQSFL